MPRHRSKNGEGQELFLLFRKDGKPVRGKPLFKTQEDAERFWNDFYAKIGPELRRQEEARRRSIEAAMHHVVASTG